ncbi:hypothetical protein ACP275_10G182200 [Erythranthe tilingii]
MRIRRRLPPCSSIPTAALLSSDLHLQPSPAPPPPSDQSMPISSRNNRWVFSQTEEEKMKQKKFGDDESYWSVEAKKISNNNDIRKIVNLCDGEEGSNKILQPSSSYAQGDYEVVPLKKRRGGFERNITDEDKVIGAEMKSKTNKKCVDQKPVVVAHEGIIGINNNSEKMKSKIVRGSVIMEGSRCSRVNGRGWRCCHPTLVGYSLCQHHLAKGRLRSSSNSISSSSTGVVRRGKVVALHGGAEPPELSGGDLAVAAVQQPLVVVTKKRTKVGVVKARSMSSLLSQI